MALLAFQEKGKEQDDAFQKAKSLLTFAQSQAPAQ